MQAANYCKHALKAVCIMQTVLLWRNQSTSIFWSQKHNQSQSSWHATEGDDMYFVTTCGLETMLSLSSYKPLFPSRV